MPSRKIDDLCPQTATKVKAFLLACDQRGIELLVTCTYRSFEEQDALYKQGRTSPGRIVTGAQAGSSFHNVRRALDVAILRPDTGVLDWEWLDEPESKVYWRILREIGEAQGLHWGGDWDRPDKPHFEDQFCSPCGEIVGPRDARHFSESGLCVKLADKNP